MYDYESRNTVYLAGDYTAELSSRERNDWHAFIHDDPVFVEFCSVMDDFAAVQSACAAGNDRSAELPGLLKRERSLRGTLHAKASDWDAHRRAELRAKIASEKAALDARRLKAEATD